MSTFGPIDPVGGFWSPDTTSLQIISDTAPSSPVEGQQWYQSDEQSIHWYNGTSFVKMLDLDAPVAYTPTPTNFTVGNGTLAGEYTHEGWYCFFTILFIYGSTSTGSGSGSAWLMTPPPPACAFQFGPIGVAELFDASLNAFWYWPYRIANATPTTAITSPGAPGTPSVDSGHNLTGLDPFTWATGDQFRITGWYRTGTFAT